MSKMTKADVEATGKPRFLKWTDVPDGCQTKTTWREGGMKPKPKAEPMGYVYSRGRGTHYALYARADVERVAKRRAGRALELTVKNVGAALFEVNNTVRRRRDAAATAYTKGRHGSAGHQKREKNFLYELKARSLRKAESVGDAVRVGYHIKQYSRRVRAESCKDGAAVDDDLDHGWDDQEEYGDDYDTAPPAYIEKTFRTYMACYEIAGYRPHLIVDELPENSGLEIKDLGKWKSRATRRPIKMALIDAIATLEGYLESSKPIDSDSNSSMS